MMIIRSALFLTVAFCGIVTGQDIPKTFNGNICNKQEIDAALIESMYWIRNFTAAYNTVNRRCQIDSTPLRQYLLQIIEEFNFQNRKGGKVRYDAAWNAMLDSSQWGDDYEQLLVRIVQKWKRQKYMMGYYIHTAMLVENSRNWFRYATDVYHTHDTTNSSDRSMVYDALMKRFDKNMTTPEEIKIESYLYAVLQKEMPFSWVSIDKFLSQIAPSYAGSRQRGEIFRRYENLISHRRNERGFSEFFGHLDSTKSYFSSLKQLTDYTPPLVIE